MPEQIIATIPKRRGEEIRITIQEYKGVPLCSVRLWYEDKAGEMRPGKDGLNVTMMHLPALSDALRDALGAAVKAGLIPPVNPAQCAANESE
jgi:hypothetical protein